MPKGLEYNAGYYKADEKKIIDNLEKQLILDIEKLNKRYIGMHITLNNTQFKLHKLKKEKDGVKVLLKDRNTGNLSTISRNGEAVIFEIEKCEKVLLGLKE